MTGTADKVATRFVRSDRFEKVWTSANRGRPRGRGARPDREGTRRGRRRRRHRDAGCRHRRRPG
ncbi:hypothetical protein ACRAWF_20065 [Streptomyces sp. L7]